MRLIPNIRRMGQSAESPPKRKMSKLAKSEERAAYLFLSPWIIGFIILLAGPIIASVYLSMNEWSLVSPPKWVGLGNYEKMVNDREFLISLKVTLRYLVMSVPVYLVTGFGLALLLNQKLRGMNVFRTVLYLPSLLAGVAVAVLWSMVLHPDLGILNQILRGIGIANPPRWLSSPDWAIPAVVLMGLWAVGGGAIIYLAGLQNIPPHLYEAAEIDGAGAWKKFRHVTLPMMTPTIFFVLITSLIGAFQVFDVAYILGGTSGGRGSSLLFYLLNLYNEGFRNGRFGYASALAWVLVILAAVVIVIIFRSSERWVYYETDSEGE
jgi:multiple sugar transport system permease protein